MYFGWTRYTLPDIFEEPHTFEWGKGHIVRSGQDVTLLGTGLMTQKCVEAAELLTGDGISAEVIHMGSIKPLDCHLLTKSVGKTGCAVTAENASVIGGFGAAIAEVLGEMCPVPLFRIGVRDQWVDSGSVNDLMKHHKMQPEDIAAAAKQAILAKKERVAL